MPLLFRPPARLLPLAALATACSCASAPTATTPAPTSPNEPRDATAAVLLEGPPLFRGDGTVRVYLDDRHTLHVGELSAPVEHADPDAWSYAWDQQAFIEVHTFDAERNAVVLATPVPEAEDPPNRYQIFVIGDAGLHEVFDHVVGSYGVHPLELPGDGTLRYVEDGWAACDRAGHPELAVLEEVVFRLDRAAGKLVESERHDTAETVKCAELAACPYVYLVDGDTEIFAGEILRNLRGRDAYALQPLSLPAPSTRLLRLRIREEKPEVTYLDEIYLVAGSQHIRPVACARSAAPYCQGDRTPHILRPGDVLELEFELPPGLATGPLELFARGYYVPTPTRSSQ